MQDRKQLIDRILREIEEWEAKLEPLKLKAELGKMEARERFEALEQTVTSATRPLRTKLKELKNETGEAWMDIADGCETSWSETKAAIKSAIARYTD
jgi:hypothetical protein